MMDYFKCIKTGCDLGCDGMSWHGDLYADNKCVVIFKSYGRNEHGYEYNHVNADSVTELGDDDENGIFLINHVSSVSKDYETQLRKWESVGICKFFGIEK